MSEKRNLAADFDALAARVSALEELVTANAAVAPAGESITSKPKKVTLTQETFKVDGAEYRLKYPHFSLEGAKVTQDEVLADKELQKKLVKSGSGVIAKVVAAIAALFIMLTPAMADTVVINPSTVEVVTSTGSVRTMYTANDLIYIYRSSNDAFEVQVKTTRSKIWGGDVDSVTISGASSTSLKLAQLRLWFLETTTTTGYRSFIGRGNLRWKYTASTNRLNLDAASNGQMLWFGSIDSLQVSGVSGASNKLTWLRASANRLFTAGGILTAGSAATVAAGAAAGTSPTVSVAGNATAGEITLVTGGSTTSTGVIATITLPVTAPNGIRISRAPSNDNAAQHDTRVFWTTTTNTIVLNATGTALTAGGTNYKWFYTAVSY